MKNWFANRRPERLARQIDSFQRSRMKRVLSDNPQLPPDLEAEARSLAVLGKRALSEDREAVRAIGERLDQRGGFSLMLEVLNRAEAVAVSQGPYYEFADRSILRSVEMAWNGIGDWRG